MTRPALVTRASFVVCAVLLAACGAPRGVSDVPGQQGVGTSTISGNVSYTQKVALPDSAIVTVGLHDQTSQKAVPGADQSIKAEGQQVPIAFEFLFDPATLSKDHTYALTATISVDGQLNYVLPEPKLVDPFVSAPISGIKLVVQPVQDDETASQTSGATSVSPLAGTNWQLGSTVANGAEITPVAGTTITLSFGGDNQVSGSAGCNDYTGAYRMAEGGQIIFTDLATTRKVCPEPEMQQEQAYLDLLGSGGIYTLSSKRLVLTLNNGQTLLQLGEPGSLAVATPALSLLGGTKWQLDSIGSAEIAQGTAITLNFGEGTDLSGSSGCNEYSGSYTTNGADIEIGPLAVTQKACEEAVMKQESAYLQALQSASQYSVESGSLKLIADGGQQVLNYAGFP